MSSNTSKEKKRRMIQFQDKWLTDPDYKEWLTKKDEFSARCNFCNIDFFVKYEGVAAVKCHKNTANHQNKEKSVKMSQTMSLFVTKTNVREEEEVIVAELCLTFHTINHHLSYRSMDCNNKLLKDLFNDSKIARHLHCGRTKMEAIATNILSPLSVKTHLKKINEKCFSISSDASNKGNVKLFPIGVQYFDTNEGIVNFVLDFYEDSNETSDAIFAKLNHSLETHSLNSKLLIAFSGDNASVNYGKHHSVYTNLQTINDKIVKANCHCHILHNTAKYAMNSLDFDVENLILKIYAHFCISAKRVESLKSCYEYSDNEYQEILRHVPTRWLSLLPAIKRLIDNIRELKDYFIGIGTDEFPKVVNEFVWSAKFNDITIPELYLYFSSHFMELFHSNIEKLEKKTTNSTHLFGLMEILMTQLENRYKLKFFGAKVKTNLQYFPEDTQKTFTKNALNVYQRAIDYLKEHFDFKQTPFKLFGKISLDSDLSFDVLSQISQMFLLNINLDQLFDETNTFNTVLNSLESDDKQLDNTSKYCKILSNGSFNNLSAVVGAVMAVPVGNDFVERVFSSLSKIWSENRSRLCIETIKAEICIKHNFNMDCLEFKKLVMNDKPLLKSVKSSVKYNWY